jgi:hypothetical protein
MLEQTDRKKRVCRALFPRELLSMEMAFKFVRNISRHLLGLSTPSFCNIFCFLSGRLVENTEPHASDAVGDLLTD